MIKKIILWGISLVILLLNVAEAQDIDDIINNMVKAIGGLEKIKEINTAVIEGRIYRGAMEIPMVIKVKKPDKVRIEITIQDKTMVQAYDGKTAWQIIPFMGTMETENIPDEEAKMLIEQADLDGPFIDYKQKGNKIELVGEEELEGNKVYKLKIIKKSGDISYFCIDKDSFIPLKRSVVIKKGDAKVVVDFILSDYKAVDGVMTPFTIENKIDGQVATSIIIGEVKYNVEIEPEIFEKPKKGADEKEKSSDKKDEKRSKAM